MKNEFVSYTQALALKKLGFDEPCFGRWLEPTELSISAPKDDEYCQKQHEFSWTALASLYQQAFRWFREKHNLCGEVYTVNMGAIDYTFQIRDLYSEDVKHNNFEAYTGGYIGTFLTYEEAEQACLDKLIEICKTK